MVLSNKSTNKVKAATSSKKNVASRTTSKVKRDGGAEKSRDGSVKEFVSEGTTQFRQALAKSPGNTVLTTFRNASRGTAGPNKSLHLQFEDYGDFKTSSAAWQTLGYNLNHLPGVSKSTDSSDGLGSAPLLKSISVYAMPLEMGEGNANRSVMVLSGVNMNQPATDAGGDQVHPVLIAPRSVVLLPTNVGKWVHINTVDFTKFFKLGNELVMFKDTKDEEFSSVFVASLINPDDGGAVQGNVQMKAVLRYTIPVTPREEARVGLYATADPSTIPSAASVSASSTPVFPMVVAFK